MGGGGLAGGILSKGFWLGALGQGRFQLGGPGRCCRGEICPVAMNIQCKYIGQEYNGGAKITFLSLFSPV